MGAEARFLGFSLKIWFLTAGLLVIVFGFSSAEIATASSNAVIEDGLSYRVIQVNAGRKLASFTSYKDVILTEYRIPPEIVSGIFGFSSQNTPRFCGSEKTISVFLQHGGFPLFILTNATWPSNVFANRSDFAYFEFPASESTWKITIPAPRAGPWYSAVFIKESVGHIKQSGLFTKCDTTYFSSFLASTYQQSIVQMTSGEKYDFQTTSGSPSDQMFRMCLTGERVDSINITVTCKAGCPLTIKARSDGLPSVVGANKSIHEMVCSNMQCSFAYFPIQNKCQYVYADFADAATISFAITVTAVKCRSPETMTSKMLMDFSDLENNYTSSYPNAVYLNESFYHISPEQQLAPSLQPMCPYVIDMARLDFTPSFTSSFGINQFSWPSAEYVFIPATVFSDVILRFDLLPYKDTGGTLYVSINLTDALVSDIENMTIVACLNLGLGSRFDIERTCQGPLLRVNSTKMSSEVLVPYPEVGRWNLNIQGHPMLQNLSARSTEFIPIKLTIKMDQCVRGSCAPHGTCRVTLNSGVLITSVCVCQAGWKGWDCNDGESADSTSDLLIAIFFLTISNLLFIPAAIVAIRRTYYTEAVVYLSTCFFSSFYHACDQPLKRLSLCIMDYGVLQFCDFYVSILSFWVTIIAMADLPAKVKSVTHMVGCIGIALGVEYEKTGLWVFAVPALTAVIILGVSWGFRSYRLRRVTPQKRYWLIHFLPGFLFAALGLVLFAFVETKTNYKFVHSVWHIVMALSVICFLPPAHARHEGKYPKVLRASDTDSDLSTTTNVSQDLLKISTGGVMA